MGRPMKSEEPQLSETSTDVPSSPKKLSAVETSVGLQVVSTTKEKQTHGANQSSFQKKHNSGTKNDNKARSRRSKKAARRNKRTS